MHLAHVANECVKVKVICNRCKTHCVRETFKQHNCVLGFINQVDTKDVDSFKTALSAMQSHFDNQLLVIQTNC